MDTFDSPAKRRKFDHFSSPNTNSSLPEIDDDDIHETVETVPLPRPGTIHQPSQYTTQPTQLIERSPLNSKLHSDGVAPVVQVAASSSPPPIPQPKPGRAGGLLASAMAPQGTAFRNPSGVRPAVRRPMTINISDDEEEDDGPKYRGGSSDDEHGISTNDIKPTKFGRSEERIEESPAKNAPRSLFQQITSAAVYKPGVARPVNGAGAPNRLTPGVSKRPMGDSMSAAYGSASKKPRQAGPSRAQPVSFDDEAEDMRISDIPDWQVRQKVKHISSILPGKSVKDVYRALRDSHLNVQDAMDWLATQEEAAEKPAKKPESVDLTASDDELAPTPIAPKVKQTTLTQHRSIQEKWSKKGPSILEKWSSTQSAPKPVAKKSPSPPPKQFKRLVRGRKNVSSPAPEPSPEPKRVVKDDSDESEDQMTDEEAPEDRSDFDTRLLNFFNTCTVDDLSDIASIDKSTAEYFLSQRPFKSMDKVRSVPSVSAQKSSKSRGGRAKPIGDKIVDKCEDMFTGYDAVDALVAKCESLGKPIAREMKDWGVDVFGAKGGEVELVSLGDSQISHHDSGIGTPQSELDADEPVRGRKTKLVSQPALMNGDIKMKDYQVVGINWLSLLFRHNLSCILADDMGLGKTCQVIAFLAHLFEIGEKGPHLVVVPASTLENWLKEFRKFCPALVVEPLYGNEKERFEIRDRIEANRDNINVIITTQHTAKAKDDSVWLRHFGFTCAVFDEAHFLRTATSQFYEKLIRIRCQFRLLLTGTPLQNNLQELMSLLGFILPTVFNEKKEELQVIFSHKAKTTDDSHEALLSTERIARARSMLTPFILRRKKHQVLKDIPNKIRRVEYCEMSTGQVDIYTAWQEKARRIMEERAQGNPPSNESANVLMKLRQAAIHELLFHHIYDKPSLLKKIAKKCLEDPQWENSNPDLIYTEIVEYSDLELHTLCAKNPTIEQFALQNEEWMDSGKVVKTVELLSKFREEGSRTLIFSQFTMVLDILELVMTSLNLDYLRLDGSTPVSARQDMIDEFNNNDIPVFMLSTKAGGAGINLATANKIIIFDSSFNPQDDIQAENRAHRIGQTKEVEVVRLISKGTIEEQIHALGLTKLALDSRVAGEDAKENEKNEKEGMKLVEDMMFAKLENENHNDGKSNAGDSAVVVEKEDA